MIYAKLGFAMLAVGNSLQIVGVPVLPHGEIKRLEPLLTPSDIDRIKREIVKTQNAFAAIEIGWSKAPE